MFVNQAQSDISTKIKLRERPRTVNRYFVDYRRMPALSVSAEQTHIAATIFSLRDMGLIG